MRRLIATILPNRIDWLVCANSLLLVLGIASALFAQGYRTFVVIQPIAFLTPVIVLLTGFAFALGFATSWKRVDRRSWLWLFGGCLTSIFAFHLTYRLTGFEIVFIPTWFQETLTLNEYSSYSLCSFVALLLVSGLVALTVRCVPKYIITLGGRKTATRQTAILSVAAILLVSGIVQNVLSPNGEWWGRIGRGWKETTIAAGIAYLLLAFFPGWSILTRQKKIFQAILILPSLLIPVALGAQCLLRGMPTDLFVGSVSLLVFALCFIAGLFLVRPDSIEKIESPSDRLKRKATPWSLLFVTMGALTTGTLLFLNQTYSLPSLVIPDVPNRWAAAKLTKLIHENTNGTVIYQPTYDFVSGEFAPDSPTDSLNIFSDTNLISRYSFSGLNPDFETSKFAALGKNTVQVFDSVLTPQQFADLATNTNSVSFQSCEFITIDSKVTVPAVNQLQISSVKPGTFSKLLGSLEPTKPGQEMQLWGEFNDKDWASILNALSEFEISVPGHGDIPSRIIESYDDQVSLQNLKLWAWNSSDESLWLKMTLKTDLCLDGFNSNFFLNTNSLEMWEVAFAKSNEMTHLPLETLAESGIDFSLTSNSDAFHWGYEWDSERRLTKVYIPNGEHRFEIEDLTELTTLSFDPGWISQNHFDRSSTVFNASIESLPNLENLYFGPAPISTFETKAGIRPLGVLKNLRHLQISIDNGNTRLVRGFDTLDGLQSLTLFGVPDNKFISEVAKCNKLQKLVAIDIYDTNSNDKWLSNARKALPNVVIEIINGSSWQPNVPDDFKAHIEAKKKKLREKLLRSNGIE